MRPLHKSTKTKYISTTCSSNDWTYFLCACAIAYINQIGNGGGTNNRKMILTHAFTVELNKETDEVYNVSQELI